VGIAVIPEGDVLTVFKIWRFESRAVEVKITVRVVARGEVVGSKYGVPGDAAASPYNDVDDLFVSVRFWGRERSRCDSQLSQRARRERVLRAYYAVHWIRIWRDLPTVGNGHKSHGRTEGRPLTSSPRMIPVVLGHPKHGEDLNPPKRRETTDNLSFATKR